MPSAGVVFRATGYYEEGTTNTYKSFASINRGGSYIPNIEISYTPKISIAVPSTTTLEEGNTLTLTATTVPANTTVTWSSGNTSIATVSSTGVVTAVHAGNVTITATAEDGSASIELLVTLPEGVYRIANNYSNLYLATRLSGASAIDVFQNGMVTSEPACTTIMWWVCHHGNGMYSFQPMSRLAYGLTYSSADNSARVSSLTTSYWKIAYDSYGYTITNEGYSHRTLSLESDTTNIGEDVIVTSQSGYLTRQRWSFSAVTTEYNGVILFNSDTNGNASTATKRYVAVGKTRGIFELGIKATAYSTDSVDQDIYWTSGDSLIAQVNSSTGQVTGMSPGTVTITAYKANESGTGGVGISDSYTIIVPELTDDTYYIRNRQHDKYVQADDATAPTYSMPGVALEQWEFDGGTHQRWELEVQYNGYYRIKSATSGLYIATQAGGEGTEDLFILQENYVSTDRQLWKITLTSHNSYKLKAKSSEPYNSDLAMVAANIVNDSSNGIQVQQRLYVDNESYKDEWYLARIGAASTVELEAQEKSLWCWVACARMFAKHSFPDVSRTQSEAVNHVKGSINDVSGNRFDIINAVNFYIENIDDASLSMVTYIEEVYSEATLRRFLDGGHVVVSCRTYFTSDSNSNSNKGGHATLIFGYVIIDSQVWFLVRDPSPVGQGKTYMITYEKLYNGYNPQEGEEANDLIWTGVVVEDTEYDDDTIPYYFNQED